MRSWIRRGTWLLLALWAVAGQAAEDPAPVRKPISDAPKMVDGRLEATAAKGPKWTNETERIELVRKAQAKRLELLGKFPPPTTLCRRVPDGAIEVDGRLDDEAWPPPAVAGPFRETRSLKEEKFPTRVRMAYDSRFLYVAFECPDDDLVATEAVPDGDFWKDDAVEVFINANGDEMSYLEFETSPLGLIFDACLADYRPEITWIGAPEELTHLDNEKGIAIYTMRSTVVKTAVAGTLNNPKDVDQGWTAEIAMSWDDLKRGLNPVHAMPPADGDVWRIGLFRVNINAGKAGNPDGYYAWNPTSGWFHAPFLFGRVVFAGR